ncbi:MAG: ABC transporter permease [Pseudomonadota bacterium]
MFRISYPLRRLLYAVPICMGVGVVCFSLIYLAPGDPLQTILPADATPEVIELMRRAYGLDKPVYQQFLLWLARAFQGDFGQSISTGRPVFVEVSQALRNTAMLAMFAVPLSMGIGFAVGALAGFFRKRWLNAVVTALSTIGVCVPNYWLGIVLVIIFSVKLMLLPSSGMGSSGSADFNLLRWDDARFLVLPVITLSLVPLGMVARSTKAAVDEVMSMEFVQTLRAVGLGEFEILRHVIKNALPAVLSVMALQFGYLMGGSILVETIFNWPGTGYLLSKAIVNRDIPVLQGTILSLALIFVVANLVVDQLQSLIDPRIRRV